VDGAFAGILDDVTAAEGLKVSGTGVPAEVEILVENLGRIKVKASAHGWLWRRLPRYADTPRSRGKPIRMILSGKSTWKNALA
jgi:hypothetical protein